jgi:hypothetical protein
MNSRTPGARRTWLPVRDAAAPRRRGAVLIVVLGVLAILALLATTFATLQATEKQVARNYLDTVRAKLLAQSGIQDAEARLRDYFPFRYFDSVTVTAPKPWKYWGTDKTETVEPIPGKDRIEDALNPSFAVEKENPQNPLDPRVEPRTIRIDGRERGLSGTHGSGTYMRHGDHYVLKISDISGRIYVNDGLDGDTTGRLGPVSQNLRRILNILGEQIAVPQLGTKLVGTDASPVRPRGGYRQPEELLRAVNYDEALYARFKDYVTTYAWVDPQVANPVPLSLAKLSDYPVTYYRGTPAIFRHGSMVSGKDARGEDVVPPGGLNTCPNVCAGGAHDNPAIRVYGLDSLNPQWIEIVSRAPVNVNAASREVLVALLTDLRGFFLGDRRRNNPRWKGDLYLSFKQQNTLSPDRNEGDEIGYLIETVPIVGPGGTQTQGISGFVIADEIIACRNRRASANFNYAAVPWGGPFRTWNQFNQFVDNLAVPKNEGGAGVLDDTRPIHKDYEEEVDDPSGFGTLVDSALQKRHAVKAIADVLKANFNPNLHLNELNPDENLFLRADKTDLIVNSTEFCFMPTGYFEVESLGRIVRAKENLQDPDAFLVDTQVVAQAKVRAVYKLYDQYRETTQRQFYAGELPPRQGAFETNSGRSLEVGPEPDNGIFPGNLGAPGDADNEWGGYVALPTVGGVDHGEPPKERNTLVRTVDTAGGPHLNAMMHVHFQLDHDAHHHLVDRREIGSVALPQEAVVNYPDVVNGASLSYGGPYAPTSGPGGPPANGIPLHRLARSFRRTLDPSGATVTEPAIAAYAPSDLRIDGGYSERHAAPSYFTRNGGAALWNFSQETGAGMVSFWWKPSFFPELTGKVRTIWDLSRYHTPCGARVHVWPFSMWFFPAQYNPALSENTGPRYFHNNMGYFQPCSLVWGTKQWHSDEIVTINNNSGVRSHNFGKITTSLNHVGHPDELVKPNILRAHHWINTTFFWKLNPTGGAGLCGFYVNGSGRHAPFSLRTMVGGTGDATRGDKINGFEYHSGREFNHMRLGAPSRICDAAATGTANNAYRGNHTGDQTIDEFYVWKTPDDIDPATLWLRGRYYKPLDGNYGEGVFTSQAISFVSPARRALPPPSSASAPGGPGLSGGSIPADVAQIRVLGLSWTWYGEGMDWEAKPPRPTLYDYRSEVGPALPDVGPRVLLGLKDGAVKYGPFEDDGFSPVRAPDGSIPALQDPRQVRYFAQFVLGNADMSTILLASPVLDDVTLYWDDGQTSLLSYVFEGRSF